MICLSSRECLTLSMLKKKTKKKNSRRLFEIFFLFFFCFFFSQKIGDNLHVKCYFITKTSLYKSPLLYSKTGVYRVYIMFLISALKT